MMKLKDIKIKKTKYYQLKIVLSLLFIIALVYASIVYAPQVVELVKNTDKFKAYINSYGAFGILVYMGFQVLQIVVAVIPGEFIQIAGGYLYGTLWGTVYTTIGILLGVIATFYLTRIFGYSIVKIFVPDDKLEKFSKLMNSPKSELVMFVLFLIPGIPKDVLTYIAGLTPIKPLRFFVLCIVARFPGIFGSCYIGSHLESKQYTEVIVVSALAVILFILGVVFQNNVIHFLTILKEKRKH